MAPSPDLKIEPLASHHDRVGFTSGVESLDQYLADAGRPGRAAKSQQRLYPCRSAPAERHPRRLHALGDCARARRRAYPARKHVPRYPLVSTTLIGRLAIATASQGQGLGASLLADGVQRAYASSTRSAHRWWWSMPSTRGRCLLRGERLCPVAGFAPTRLTHGHSRKADYAVSASGPFRSAAHRQRIAPSAQPPYAPPVGGHEGDAINEC